jgi:hypothetical protein
VVATNRLRQCTLETETETKAWRSWTRLAPGNGHNGALSAIAALIGEKPPYTAKMIDDLLGGGSM